MVADPAARPAGRDRLPVHASVGLRGWSGLLAEPDAPVGPDELEDFAAARTRTGSATGPRFAGGGAVAEQVRFEREWGALRRYAAARGVRLIGDLPIYVAPGGADHTLPSGALPAGLVAGAPPDALSASGQLWGNPLYDWPALQRRGYRWWIERFRRSFELVDLVRVDHFRGFVAYWAVPEGAETAVAGSWQRGPGRAGVPRGRG